jgi:D-lactate dehydrogenase
VSAIQGKGCLAICVFVNDDCSEPVIAKLAAFGVKLIMMLNRKLHQAYMRNKNGQYVLDGLVVRY